MLGAPVAALASEFGLSEHWVRERIEAVRLCGKQIRLNLFDSVDSSLLAMNSSDNRV